MEHQDPNKRVNNQQGATVGAGSEEPEFGMPAESVKDTGHATPPPESGPLAAFGGFAGGSKAIIRGRGMAGPSIEKPGYPMAGEGDPATGEHGTVKDTSERPAGNDYD